MLFHRKTIWDICGSALVVLFGAALTGVCWWSSVAKTSHYVLKLNDRPCLIIGDLTILCSIQMNYSRNFVAQNLNIIIWISLDKQNKLLEIYLILRVESMHSSHLKAQVPDLLGSWVWGHAINNSKEQDALTTSCITRQSIFQIIYQVFWV